MAGIAVATILCWAILPSRISNMSWPLIGEANAGAVQVRSARTREPSRSTRCTSSFTSGNVRATVYLFAKSRVNT